ncbi:hypothetical protein RugamoR64_63130 [Duganella rhizosphaerae]|uniref:hypothetical protein n=1 Tax=Duganella rhizosphaerae TaxID=2885763 RepID=UPI0030E83C91
MRRLSGLQLLNLLLAAACLVLCAGYFASGRAQDGFWSVGTTLAFAVLLLFNAFWKRKEIKPAYFCLLLAAGLLQVYVFILKVSA